jgi:hypothetical protein
MILSCLSTVNALPTNDFLKTIKQLDMVAATPKLGLEHADYYKASKEFTARFQDENASTKALLNTVTKTPTLNLENFPTVRLVSCPKDLSKDYLNIYFTSRDNAARAFAAWSQTPDMTLVLGQQRKCKKDAIAFFSYYSIKLDATKVVMKVKETEYADVLEEYSLEYSSSPENALHKREVKKAAIPLNINFDEKTQSVVRPSIPIFTEGITSLSCENCHTKGQIDIAVKIKGNRVAIWGYNVAIDGNLFGNLGLLFQVKPGTLNTQKQKLFSYPILPISLGGLFTLSPAVSLSVSGSFNVQSRLEVSTGGTIDVPLHVIIERQNLITPPRASAFIKADVNFKPIKLFADAKGTAAANLHPEVKLGLTGLGGLVNFGVGVDYQQSAIATAQACAHVTVGNVSPIVPVTISTVFGTSLYWKQQRYIYARAFGKEKELFHTEPTVYDLPCPQCAKCVPQ